MDYTQSPEFVTHAGTGNRMHAQNQAVPTVVSDKDLNAVNWSLMELVKAAGLAGQQFDPGTPATYQVVRNAMAELLRRGYGTVGSAGGTGDAITLTLSPPPVALVDGMTVRVRAAAANTVAAPTLAIGTLAAKPIVKGSNTPLDVGNVAGAGHWLELQFDALLDKWVLLNPLNVSTLPAGTEILFGGTSAPAGFIKLNGSVPLVTSVPNLVANVYCGDANNGTASFYYRCTDPLNPATTRSTTGNYFALKNARGRFPRALADGDTLDGGRSAWSYQEHQYQDHQHGVPIRAEFATDQAWRFFGTSNAGSNTSGFQPLTTGGLTGNPGGENRPFNYPSLVCVKT